MLSTGEAVQGAYRGLAHGWRQIVAGRDGVRGLYRGWLPSLFSVSHGAVQFAVYEQLKQAAATRSRSRRTTTTTTTKGRRQENDDDDDTIRHEYTKASRDKTEHKPSNASTLLFSAIAKIAAVGLTYPLQLVRARLQAYDAPSSLYRAATTVIVEGWRREGWMGFYKGCVLLYLE